MRTIFSTAAIALLTGCASTPAVRELANNTGRFVGSLSGGTSDFLENQNRLNALNAARLDTMAADGNADRANVRQQRLAWVDSSDRVRIATADLATSRSADEILASLETRATTPLRVDATALAGYAATQKALAEVAARPKTAVILRELVTFGTEVHQGFNDLVDKAKKAQGEAATNTATADATTTTSAATTPK
jgi:peptide subunit release factor 1 (eRF1)